MPVDVVNYILASTDAALRYGLGIDGLLYHDVVLWTQPVVREYSRWQPFAL